MTDKDDDLEDEDEIEEGEKAVTPEEIDEALTKYAEEYRAKSGVDPHDHPHFAKAKALIGKMKCR